MWRAWQFWLRPDQLAHSANSCCQCTHLTVCTLEPAVWLHCVEWPSQLTHPPTPSMTHTHTHTRKKKTCQPPRFPFNHENLVTPLPKKKNYKLVTQWKIAVMLLMQFACFARHCNYQSQHTPSPTHTHAHSPHTRTRTQNPICFTVWKCSDRMLELRPVPVLGRGVHFRIRINAE